MTLFLQLLVNGVLIGILYALLALGFVLIAKGSGVINFAQGELVLLGGYLVAVLLGASGENVFIALGGAMAVMVVVGVVIERGVLRPLVNEPLLSLVMATIAIGTVIRGLVPMIWGTSTRSVTTVFPTGTLEFGDIRIQKPVLWAAAFALLFIGAFAMFFMRSRMGLAMQAVSDDRIASQSLGVDTRRINAIAWGTSGVTAAFTGYVWGSVLGVDPLLGMIGILVFPVVILGGIDSIAGALVGGITVGIVEGMAGGYLDPIVGGGFSLVAPLLLLLIVLMVRPYGLFGRREIERV
jgi:branched-chain amino acid transport system permease protein